MGIQASPPHRWVRFLHWLSWKGRIMPTKMTAVTETECIPIDRWTDIKEPVPSTLYSVLDSVFVRSVEACDWIIGELERDASAILTPAPKLGRMAESSVTTESSAKSTDLPGEPSNPTEALPQKPGEATAKSEPIPKLSRAEEIEVLRHYLKTDSNPTIRGARKKLGRSQDYISKLPPWLEHMARKNRKNASQSVSAINLHDGMLDAREASKFRESSRFESTEVDERLDAEDPQQELEKLIGEQREDDQSRYVR